MSDHDLSGTADHERVPVPVTAAPQDATKPEMEESRDAAPVLDLRGYQLMERLGVGGMGDVYRAVDPALGRDLAVKVLKAELRLFPSAQRRFVREARVTGSLQHPCIVPIYNLGRLADGRLHYTMRLVHGRTLAAILQEEAGRPERLPTLLTIFEKVCQAVAYAHSKRVIHRDLKPANVMVGRFGEVQVMDWGLAKLLAPGERGCVSAPSEAEEADDRGATQVPTEEGDTPPQLTRQGQEMGTPAYMPPEQALGEWDTVDERADVFALGAILCVILTGQPPYRGNTTAELLQKAKRGDLAEALTRLEGCDADAALVALGRDCLARAREDRPRDAEQVAQRVASYQAEVQERLRHAELERAAAVVKVREERKRRRLALTFVLLLSAAAIISGWLAVRATDAADAERQAKQEAVEQGKLAEEQKNQAETSARKAEKSEADTKAVLEFFQNKVLSAARPKDQEGGLGTDATLRQAVDKAKKDIGDAFKDRPLVEASIRDTLGTTYLYLGEPALAIEQYERALALHETQLGPDHSDTLKSRSNLAEAYRLADRIGEAIHLNEQTLKHMETQLGPDHPDTLSCRNNLALAYADAGRITDALRLHEQTLKQCEAKLGPDHADTLAALNNLAEAYLAAGRAAEAIRLHEQTLKQIEAKLGPDHPYTLNSRYNLAGAYQSAGRTAEAIRLYEQALKQMEARLGTDHPHTLTCLANLASAYWSTGRTTEAIRLFEQVLKRAAAKFGEDHPNTLTYRSILANAYRSVGRADEAVRLLEQNLKHYGALAQTYEQAGQFAKAESIYRNALEQAQQQFGSNDLRTAASLAQLGLILLKQKKFHDAEPLLSQALTIREKKQPDVWTTFTTRSLLGEALLGQKKYTEAEPLLLQGYEGMNQRQDKIPSGHRQIRLREALERLVRLYEATDQKNKAADWRKKLEEAKAPQKKAKL